MESRFGHDFGAVRVHDDARAAASAQALRSAAYTSGSHIVFAAGAYMPHSARGAALLAHELVHVLQHRVGTAPADSPLVGKAGDEAECQAERVLGRLAVGLPAGIARPTPPSTVFSLADEDWYRGYAEGLPTAPDASKTQRGVKHDLGNGIYFSDRPDVADVYADRRTEEVSNPAVRRVIQGRIDPHSLGRVLDLTKEPDFMKWFAITKKYGPVNPDRYRPIFDRFMESKGLRPSDFDVIIGPEGVLGGRQMCIRDPKIATQVMAGMTPVKPGGGPAPPNGGKPSGRAQGGVPAPVEAAGTTSAVGPKSSPHATTMPVESPRTAPRVGGGRLRGAAKVVAPLILVAVNNYLMAQEDARLVPGRVERALVDQALQSKAEDLVDRQRLDIARKQHRGASVYVTVRIKLVFTNGIQDSLYVYDPKLTDTDQTESLAPIRMSDEPVMGTETSVGWVTGSVLLEPVGTSRSEQIGLQLEQLDAQGMGAGPQTAERIRDRSRLQEEQRTALKQEEQAREAEISKPSVITDPTKRGKQQAVIIDRLRALNKAVSQPELSPRPPGPPALTVTPAPPLPTSFLPGAPSVSPILQAAAFVRQFETWTKRLEAKAQALDSRFGSEDSPTPQERQAFLVEEENWRLSAKYAMNRFRTDGRDEAVNALGELLDRYGPTFAGNRSRLGG